MLITTPKPSWTSGFFFVNCFSPGSLHGQSLFIFQVSTQHFIISERTSFTLLCRSNLQSYSLSRISHLFHLIATGKTRFSCLLAYCFAPFHLYKFHEGKDHVYPIALIVLVSRIVAGPIEFHHLSGKLKGE